MLQHKPYTCPDAFTSRSLWITSDIYFEATMSGTPSENQHLYTLQRIWNSGHRNHDVHLSDDHRHGEQTDQQSWEGKGERHSGWHFCLSKLSWEPSVVLSVPSGRSVYGWGYNVRCGVDREHLGEGCWAECEGRTAGGGALALEKSGGREQCPKSDQQEGGHGAGRMRPCKAWWQDEVLGLMSNSSSLINGCGTLTSSEWSLSLCSSSGKRGWSRWIYSGCKYR